MKMSDRDLGIAVLGLALVGATAYAVVSRTGATGTDSAGLAPAREGTAGSLNVAVQGVSAIPNMLGIDGNGLSFETRLLHFFHPDGPMPLNPPNQQYRHTPHRYPTVSGTNINTLIHRGYSPLMVPAKQDYDWMTNPPAESML